MVTKFPSTRTAATCSKKAGDGLTDPFFFFFTGSPPRLRLGGKVRPPSGPLTMNPELRKENCDHSVITCILLSFVFMSVSLL
jgi:hypothetical protein